MNNAEIILKAIIGIVIYFLSVMIWWAIGSVTIALFMKFGWIHITHSLDYIDKIMVGMLLSYLSGNIEFKGIVKK